jgi:hypothetical protein
MVELVVPSVELKPPSYIAAGSTASATVTRGRRRKELQFIMIVSVDIQPQKQFWKLGGIVVYMSESDKAVNGPPRAGKWKLS